MTWERKREKKETYYELVDIICINKHIKWKIAFEMYIIKSYNYRGNNVADVMMQKKENNMELSHFR